jgi:hypothetical protein
MKESMKKMELNGIFLDCSTLKAYRVNTRRELLEEKEAGKKLNKLTKETPAERCECLVFSLRRKPDCGRVDEGDIQTSLKQNGEQQLTDKDRVNV